MKNILFLLIIALASCSKWCEPNKIMSGESNRHHDSKQFHAKITGAKQYGPFCKVRYVNMKEIGYTVCKCDCKDIKVSNWTTIKTN